jgi:hypothetical protein
MKLNLAAVPILAALFFAAPMIVSADATTTGSGSTLSSPVLVAYHSAHRRHHRHRRHRHPRVSAASSL